MLKEKLTKVLNNQGRDYNDFQIHCIIEDFREEQINAMLEVDLDLTDLDRWKALERIVGIELECSEAMGIINKFWEYDIDVIDIPYNNQ